MDSPDRTWRRYVLALLLVTAGAGALRAARMNHVMRYDESFTFLEYVLPSPSHVFDYSSPNNHVLNTLLINASTRIGGITPPWIRLPAFLAGLLLAPAGAGLARRLSGRDSAGIAAAVLIGASSILIEYSVNARGYSMVALAGVVLATLSLELSRDVSRRRLWVLWVVVAAVGMFAIPVMAYAVLACAATFAIHVLVGPAPRVAKRHAIRKLILAMIVSAVLTAGLYVPVIYHDGLGVLIFNPFVMPHALGVVLRDLPVSARSMLGDWTRDTSAAWQAVVAAGLVWALLRGVAQRSAIWWLPVVGAVTAALAVLAQRVVPPPRAFLFLLPMVLAISAAGLDDLASHLHPRRAQWLGAILVGLIVVGVSADAAMRTSRRAILASEDTKGCLLPEAERIIIDAAEASDGQAALAWDMSSANWPSLRYYAVLHDPAGKRIVRLATDPNLKRILIVVDFRHTLQQVLEVCPFVTAAFADPQPIAQYPHATLYQIARKAASTSAPATQMFRTAIPSGRPSTLPATMPTSTPATLPAAKIPTSASTTSLATQPTSTPTTLPATWPASLPTTSVNGE